MWWHSGILAAALGYVAAVGAFHTPYRPEQSRHYDVTKTETFKPITEKVRFGPLHFVEERRRRGRWHDEWRYGPRLAAL